MNVSRKLKIALLAVVVGLFGLEAGEQVSFPRVSGFFSIAEASVGRPAHSCQRCRRGGADEATDCPPHRGQMCEWRLQLLINTR